MTQPRNPFTQTGALAQNDPLFRGRADELARLEQACLNDHKSFLLVYGGRQNGKTTLLLQLEARLREQLPDRVRVCRIDFQDIPRVTTDAAFQHLIAELRRSLPHLPALSPGAGIPELRGFLEQALAGDEVQRLVLLLDEMARLPESTREDLAHVIRALHTHRLVSPALAKTQFVLAGGLELYNLAIVQASTLRNVCEIVRLGDLSESEATTLIVNGLTLVGVEQAAATTLGQTVYARIGGHPYLTQRVGGLLAERQLRDELLNDALVEALCWALLDDDDALLEHLRRSITELGLQDSARRLLTASQRTNTTDDNTGRLELLGLARRAGRYWVPRSPLLAVAIAEWLHLPLPTHATLTAVAIAAQGVATQQYMNSLKLEQTVIAQRGASAATVAEQLQLQRRAADLATQIAQIEALQSAAQPAIPSEPSPAPAPNQTLLDSLLGGQVIFTGGPTLLAARHSSLLIPELVKVPAGRFLMGSSKDDKQADGHEQPQHALELPDYWIGKTPVTNAQFRSFVEGDGYTNQKYWTKAGWQWRVSEKIAQPGYWDDTDWNGPDFPVVGVSWFDAVAYCRWLSEQTGQEFRLPSEAEWEKAARGPDGRIWPWGNTWEAGCCNSSVAGSGKTTPVGQYPNGASPYGVLDMAGNVWEWCATQWRKKYPYGLEDEWQAANLEANQLPVLRGGSWHEEQRAVRGAYRDGGFNFPRYRFLEIGLRVASHSLSPAGS